MDQPITLRRLGPDDLALLVGVTSGLFDNPVRADWAGMYLADPLHDMVVALVHDDVVGMASGQMMYHPDKPPAYFINEVGVRDAFQRQGIAARLCNMIKDIAKLRGCEGIWVATETENIAARALYRSLNARATPDIVVFDWGDRAIDG